MQKLRLRYAKRGRLRFTSHRDIARAFERALRRTGVPMAYSQGFNPHPKVSWVGAAPTGVASEAEYVEIQVVEVIDPDVLRAELDGALPDGLDLIEVVVARGGVLPDRIDAGQWRIDLPGVPVDRLRSAVDALLTATSVEVQRLTKSGNRMIDVRPALVSAGVSEQSLSPRVSASSADDTYGILELVVRQTTPAVRPDDVLNALRVVAGLEPPVPAKATRMAQGRLDDVGRLSDPLAQDRAGEN